MNSRLASLLVQEGLVAPKTMADAFQRQVIYGGTLDTILLEMNALAEAPLLLALGRASALPAADTLPSLEKLKAASVHTWFPLALAEKYRAVPLGVEGQVVRVLTLDPADRRALDALGREIGRALEPVIGPEHRFVHALSLIYDVLTPARFQSLQARLARRAAQAGGAPASVSTAPAPVVAAPVVAAPVVAAPVVAAPVIAAKVADTIPEAPVAAPIFSPTPVPLSVPAEGRSIVTDLPLPASMPGAPVSPQDSAETPRLTSRELGAPATVQREIAAPIHTVPAIEEPADPLNASAAVAAIDAATDRDQIFSALCRGARSRADYVVLFTVHADTMVGRVALADTWIDRSRLAAVSLSLEAATPFRTAALGRSALVGKVGEDPQSGALLTAVGRRPPMPAVIVPVVLRERTVALLYADCSGKGLPAATTGELANSAAAAARAFQRLILSAKGRDFRAAPSGDGPSSRPGETMGTKLAAASAMATTVDPGGGWHSAGDESTARLPATARALHSAQTQIFRATATAQDEAASLFASVERGDEHARLSADKLLALGAQGAELTIARLPGPLRIDRTSYRGLTPPLADHGPLLALIARFGDLALPHLVLRLEDPRPEVRFYVTLAVGEIGRDAYLPQIAARLFDREAAVRRVAIDTLVKHPGSAEKTALIESLRGELPGPEERRQQLAADALGALGDAPSVPRLVELVKHEDEDVRRSAHLALVGITKQDFGNSRWRWRGWWDRHKNESRDEWLFEGLAHASDEVRASSAEELKRQLHEHFGYQWDAPKREREEARRRWLEWYRSRRA